MAPPVIPASWNKPPAILLHHIDEASKHYANDEAEARELRNLLVGVAYRENSSWKKNVRGGAHGDASRAPVLNKRGNKVEYPSKRYINSYKVWKGLKIPGSSLTWGDKFAPYDWRPYGVFQLNPYHIYGKAGGIRAKDPLEKMFDYKVQAFVAARLLAEFKVGHKDSDGTWDKALRLYNGDSGYYKDVLRNIRELKEANTPTSEGIAISD